jgi:hypothetical protein
MGIVNRLVVATFTVLLLTAWTVPVCCLSMADAPSHSQPSSAAVTPMSGHQHHHHHQATESNDSSKRLAANDLCAQNCQRIRGMVAVSVSGRDGLILRRTMAMMVAPMQAAVLSPRLLTIYPSSPPGILVAFSDGAVPLRI